MSDCLVCDAVWGLGNDPNLLALSATGADDASPYLVKFFSFFFLRLETTYNHFCLAVISSMISF